MPDTAYHSPLVYAPRTVAFAAPARVLALAGVTVLTAACLMVVHRNGLAVTPDGWAYWQGAISLAEGRGYTYFSGHSILAWPPLFSVYLAVWVRVLGPTVLVLGVATSVLVGLQAAAWLGLALRLAPVARRPLALALAALFIAAFLVVNQSQPLAHAMLYLFLPLQLGFAHAVVQGQAPRLRAVAGLALTSMLAALSHHLGLAFSFVICAAVILLSARRGALLVAMLATAVLALLAWLATRVVFGQVASHAVGAGQAAQPPLAYLAEGLAGSAQLLAPGPAGWVMLAVLAALVVVYRRDAGVRFAAVLAVLLFLASLLLFSLTRINDPFAGRFVHFVPLLVVPPLMLRVAATSAPRVVLFAALILPGLVYAGAQAIAVSPEDATPNAAAISREAPPGELVVRGHRLLVGPIDWEEPDANGVPPR